MGTKNKEGVINKAALVTGSSRGIGHAIAIELAKSGIDIIVNCNPQEGIEVVDEINKIGQRATYIQSDGSDSNQKKMVKRIIN